MRATFNATHLGLHPRLHPLPFVFGAVVALTMTPAPDVTTGVRDTTGVLGPPLLVLFLVSVISHNALNLYGTVLSVIICAQTFVPHWIPTARTRLVPSWAVMASRRTSRSASPATSSRTSSNRRRPLAGNFPRSEALLLLPRLDSNQQPCD